MMGFTLAEDVMNSLMWLLYEKGLLKLTVDNALIKKVLGTSWRLMWTWTFAPFFPQLLHFICDNYQKDCWHIGAHEMTVTVRAREMPKVRFEENELAIRAGGQIELHAMLDGEAFHAITISCGMYLGVTVDIDYGESDEWVEDEKTQFYTEKHHIRETVTPQFRTLQLDDMKVVSSAVGSQSVKLGFFNFIQRLMTGTIVVLGNWLIKDYFPIPLGHEALPFFLKNTNLFFVKNDMVLDSNVEWKEAGDKKVAELIKSAMSALIKFLEKSDLADKLTAIANDEYAKR